MEFNNSPLYKNLGWIEVITGCMFSGKTEELIRRLRRAEIAKQKIMVFKPSIDSRYSKDKIVSHNYSQMNSTIVNNASEILDAAKSANVIGIDEAQFFDNNIVNICNNLADSGKRVIVAGLDMDYKGEPFGPMPLLLAVSEYITKTLAICMVCGNPADRTQRIFPSSERVLVGASEYYEARCRIHHNKLPEKT